MPSHQQQQTPQQETEAASILGVELPDVGAMWSDFSAGWSNANDMAAMQNSVGNAALQEQLARTETCGDEEVDTAAVATTYTVVAGDTLGSITKKLGRPVGEYTTLYEANTNQLASPNAVEVGQVLQLPEAWTGVAPDAVCEQPVEVEQPGYAEQAGQALGGAYNAVESAAGDAINAANEKGSELWDWVFGEDEAPDLSECENEVSEDVLLDVPWFSQFYYYKADGSILTDPKGHGETQSNGEKALTSKNAADKVLAAPYAKELLFEPSDTSCNMASRAMMAQADAAPGEGYDAIQIFYSGDEVNTEKVKSTQLTALDRSDPEQMEVVKDLTATGIEYMDGELDAGRSVLVAVSYKASTYNRQDSVTRTPEQGDPAHAGESRADHFVVVIGRQGGDYVFNDPGSQWSAGRKNQHFVLDADGVLVRDPAEVEDGENAYEVTQIRRNAM